jgi:dUTPase
MIIQPYLKVTPVESLVNKKTERGEKGFGSSNESKYWKLQNNVNIE